MLTRVTPTMPAFTDEILGPVAAVTVFKDDEEAIELANHSEYGLAAAIVSASIPRALDIARRLRVGMVHINDQTVADSEVAPFGGLGASGNGSRVGAISNVEEFSQWQWVTMRAKLPAFP